MIGGYFTNFHMFVLALPPNDVILIIITIMAAVAPLLDDGSTFNSWSSVSSEEAGVALRLSVHVRP